MGYIGAACQSAAIDEWVRSPFSSKLNRWMKEGTQQQVLVRPLNTSPDSQKNTVEFSLSLFPALSVCLTCLFSFTVCSSLLLLCLFNPPLLFSFFFLSEFLSLSRHTPAKTDESGMFPHCTQQWMTAVLSGTVCVCVFSRLFCSLFSNLFFSFHAYTHKTLTVSTVSPCLL